MFRQQDVYLWGFERLGLAIKSSVMANKLHTAYQQPRKVKLYKSEPLSFRGCRVRLPSSMADFAPRPVNVIYI